MNEHDEAWYTLVGCQVSWMVQLVEVGVAEPLSPETWRKLGGMRGENSSTNRKQM